jgi:antitoxin ParD1/3/4
MTHSITIELPENIYQPLAEEAKAKGQKVEEIALEKLAKDVSSQTDEEFERLADELADFFEKNLPADAKPLSDYAMSREGIYEDHP